MEYCVTEIKANVIIQFSSIKDTEYLLCANHVNRF